MCRPEILNQAQQAILAGQGTTAGTIPLLTALEKTIGKSDYLEFMKSFKYPLAGEFSFRRNVLPELRISSALTTATAMAVKRSHDGNHWSHMIKSEPQVNTQYPS
jgi:hypothetical protein